MRKHLAQSLRALVLQVLFMLSGFSKIETRTFIRKSRGLFATGYLVLLKVITYFFEAKILNRKSQCIIKQSVDENSISSDSRKRKNCISLSIPLKVQATTFCFGCQKMERSFMTGKILKRTLHSKFPFARKK